MGQRSLLLAPVPAELPFCKETTDPRSWMFSGSGDVARGEADDPPDETVLSAVEEIRDEVR